MDETLVSLALLLLDRKAGQNKFAQCHIFLDRIRRGIVPRWRDNPQRRWTKRWSALPFCCYHQRYKCIWLSTTRVRRPGSKLLPAISAVVAVVVVASRPVPSLLQNLKPTAFGSSPNYMESV